MFVFRKTSKIMNLNYFKESLFAVTICNEEGIIIYMNEKSIKTFAKDGGVALIGKSLFECHPEPSRSMIVEMLKTQKENSYTIEKNGIKKLIHQTPWFEAGKFKGYIELSIEILFKLPHFIRK
jgi:transcriptional regulator with PAS, ATPase and Fis domain